MNTEGGKVIYRFVGDSSDLDKKTNNVSVSLGNMTKSILTATGVTKALAAAFNMVKNSMDGAIARYDTMNNFPKVMKNLGIATEDAQESIDLLSEKLVGIPTTLDQAAMAVQRFTSANGDVKKSTDIFLAVNNAILAGGASADIQASALEQLSQAYAKGKPDMMEWRTLMTAMPAQLNQVAKAMGYISSADLGEAVREDGGEAEFSRMIETIQRLNTEGVEGFANFEEQARGATGGIGTAMTNMKSRVTAGVTGLIEAIDKGLKENGIGGIAEIFDTLGTTIKNTLIQLAPYVTEIITMVVTYAPPILAFLQEFLPYLLPIVAAVGTFLLYLKAMSIINTIKNMVMALNAVLMANPIGLIIAAIAAVIALIVLLWTKCEWFRNLVYALWDGLKILFAIIVEHIKNKIIRIIESIKSVIEVGKSVIEWFKNLPGKMLDIGKDIVRGIGNGITNGFSWLKNKIKEFVGNVTDFIKKVFKIGSPSKLMAQEVGQWLPKGIGVGIEANTDSVSNAMKDLQKSVVSGFDLDSSLSSSLHYSPNVIVNNNISSHTDPLGQVVTNIKTFANGAKNDYNYGMGV